MVAFGVMSKFAIKGIVVPQIFLLLCRMEREGLVYFVMQIMSIFALVDRWGEGEESLNKVTQSYVVCSEHHL